MSWTAAPQKPTRVVIVRSMNAVPLLEDRSCPAPCLFPVAYAPIMEDSICGLTSGERQHVKSEETARLPTVCSNKDESASHSTERMAAKHLDSY